MCRKYREQKTVIKEDNGDAIKTAHSQECHKRDGLIISRDILAVKKKD